MTENHCDDGGKRSLVEGLGRVGVDGETSGPFSGSFPFFGDFEPLSEGFFSLDLNFSAGRGATSSFVFPPTFFFEGPASRSFKNAETSTARAGYFTRPEDEKRSRR